MAILIAVEEGADPARTALLALFHDAPESRLGDRNYVQRVHTSQNVSQAVAGLLDGTAVESLGHELWMEWTEVATLEAASAHDADIVDCDLELREQSDSGAALPGMLEATRAAARSALRTATARRLWDAIQGRSSHSWHLSARNRLNAGDWAAQESDTT